LENYATQAWIRQSSTTASRSLPPLRSKRCTWFLMVLFRNVQILRDLFVSKTAAYHLRQLLFAASMKTQNLRDFYEELLADMLDAENQLIKALPKDG
jgi:hypothetical protein